MKALRMSDKELYYLFCLRISMCFWDHPLKFLRLIQFGNDHFPFDNGDVGRGLSEISSPYYWTREIKEQAVFLHFLISAVARRVKETFHFS